MKAQRGSTYLKSFCLKAMLGLSGWLLVACSTAPASHKNTDNTIAFDDMLANTNALHAAQSVMRIEADIRQYMRNLPGTEVGFSEDELQSMAISAITSGSGTNRIAQGAAASDIDLLFRMFYYCYGCYDYFGGKSAFDAAETAVLQDIAVLGEKLTVGDLSESIRNRLSFVLDGHVTIGEQALLPAQNYYYNDTLSFQKDAQGYWILQDGIRQYLSQAEGAPAPDAYMKLSIVSGGGLEYQFGTLEPAGQESIDISFRLGGELCSVTLTETVTGASYNRAQLYAETRDGPAPVITYRSCMNQDANQQFLASAALFRQEPVTILDLRGNTGGSMQSVYAWLKATDLGGLGDFEKKGGWAFRLTSKANGYLKAQYAGMANPPFGIGAALQLEQRTAESYWKDYEYGRNQTYLQSTGYRFEKKPHDGLLFVLMDQATWSAAEHLLQALRNIDNVIFVGTNSGGRMVGGLGTCFGLPNSKLKIEFGNQLSYLYDERVFVEGGGFLPDIWVGGDALEAVLALIEDALLFGNK